MDKIYPQLAPSEEAHPRVTALRKQVLVLSVDDEYRNELLRSIDTYTDQIISRPYYAANEGWDDLEALQQVTLADRNDRALQALLVGNRSSEL